MRRMHLDGFTLVELLVVIAIIGTLILLIGPGHGLAAREAARITTCMNNLRLLQTALETRESSLKEYPGYINSLGKDGGKTVRASWTVTTLPYLESGPWWESWSQGEPSFAQLEWFICPSDPPAPLDAPALSYAANSGHAGKVADSENHSNGVFFDRSRITSGVGGPADEREERPDPMLVSTRKYLEDHDGLRHTLLLAERNQSLYWGYISEGDQQCARDRKFHFGFIWNQPKTVAGASVGDPAKSHRPNGDDELDECESFAQMTVDDGFPSSFHPEIINMAFADGSVRNVSETIDPLVYAQLMTSDCTSSDLVNASGQPDSELDHPSDEDY